MNRALLGAAGVHFVCGELYRRGHIALATTRSTKAIDVLASSADGARQAAIQVKTSSNGRVWRLSDTAEKLIQPRLFYAFVGLADERPTYRIAPSEAVAKYVRTRHEQFMARPDRHGQPHKDSTVRVFADPAGQWLNRWDLLGLDTEGGEVT